MCWTATAKCERDLGNPIGERACHIRAAKQYISEETQDNNQGFFSPLKENLHVNCLVLLSSLQYFLLPFLEWVTFL